MQLVSRAVVIGVIFCVAWLDAAPNQLSPRKVKLNSNMAQKKKHHTTNIG